jgi:hypothetical protein
VWCEELGDEAAGRQEKGQQGLCRVTATGTGDICLKLLSPLLLLQAFGVSGNLLGLIPGESSAQECDSVTSGADACVTCGRTHAARDVRNTARSSQLGSTCQGCMR